MQALFSLKGKLKVNVKMNTGLLDKLPRLADGFMSREEVQAVRNKPNDAEQMDQVIEILLGKKNTDFKVFCNILRDSNYGVWADELEKKAKEIRAGIRAKGRDLVR